MSDAQEFLQRRTSNYARYRCKIYVGTLNTKIYRTANTIDKEASTFDGTMKKQS